MEPTNQLDINGWHLNTAYVVNFDLIPAEVRVEFGGETIASSSKTRVMYELGHSPIYYFPRSDVELSLLELSDHSTYCPYKGHASYWSVRTEVRSKENVIWCYENPHQEVARIGGHMGLYWGLMDAWFEDGIVVDGPRDIPGRIDTTNQLKALFPELAAQWHPTRNSGSQPYEFSAESNELVWWQDDIGSEWCARIRDRVLEVTKLRADGDATPYG